MATIKEAVHRQWPWSSAAKSVLGSSHCHYKGIFTWTAAVTIIRPSQHWRVAMATIKEGLHGQWPWPSAANSVLGSSHCHYKGVFTWTVTVAISRPGHQKRAAMATIKETLQGQWPVAISWPGQQNRAAMATHKGVFTWTVAVALS